MKNEDLYSCAALSWPRPMTDGLHIAVPLQLNHLPAPVPEDTSEALKILGTATNVETAC